MSLFSKYTRFLIGRNILMGFCALTFHFSFSQAIHLSALQSTKKDSLIRILQTTQNDTNRVKTLNALAVEINKNDSALILSQQALRLAEKLNWARGEGQARHQIGYFYYQRGEYDLSLQNYFRALKIWENEKASGNMGNEEYLMKSSKTCGNLALNYSYLSNYPSALKYLQIALDAASKLESSSDPQAVNFAKRNVAIRLTSIGNVYYDLGDFPRALDHYLRALKKNEEMDHREGMASDLINIGNIYMDRSENDKALEYFKRAMNISKNLDHIELYINAHIGVGNVYLALSNFNEALDYYTGALKIVESSGMKSQEAHLLGNIGNVYLDQGMNERAEEYYIKSLKLKEELGQKKEVALTLGNMGLLYYNTGKYAISEDKLLEALNIALDIGALDQARDAYINLSNLHSKTGYWDKAYSEYKNYLSIKDSLFNEENTKKTVQLQMQYEFDKKEAAARSAQDKINAVHEQKNRRKNRVIWFVATGLVLVMVLSLFLFSRVALIKKQKHLISGQKKDVETQKLLLDEKQKELLDSIHYAQRIQHSLMPTEKYIQKFMNK